jgi:hypothetical protein
VLHQAGPSINPNIVWLGKHTLVWTNRHWMRPGPTLSNLHEVWVRLPPTHNSHVMSWRSWTKPCAHQQASHLSYTLRLLQKKFSISPTHYLLEQRFLLYIFFELFICCVLLLFYFMVCLEERMWRHNVVTMLSCGENDNPIPIHEVWTSIIIFRDNHSKIDNPKKKDTRMK